MFNNFIANMYGPDFLKFFLVLTIIAIYFCRRFVKSLDDSTLNACPKIEKEIDPYEVAYLRGGSNEVIRFAIFNLKENGYIEIDTKKKPHRVICGDKPLSNKKIIEYNVFRFIEDSQKKNLDKVNIRELFSEKLANTIESDCSKYKEKGLSLHLLCTQDMLSRSKKMVTYTFLFLLGLGGYKFVAALNSGHFNLIFLFIFVLILFVTMVAWLKKIVEQRLTKLGEKYIANLQKVFIHLKKEIMGENASLEFQYPLAVSIFGMSVLSSSAMGNPYKDTFSKATSSSCGGGCSSCSSGGDGGSGCGGGGCGGGCGGCGG